MAEKETDIEDAEVEPDRKQTKPCQPCCRKNAKIVADVYCEDCGEYQCNECSKVHLYFPVMATHTLINKTEVNTVLRGYDMKGLGLCYQHGEILEFLCEDDYKLCCSTCSIVNHRKCHNVVEIKEKAKEIGPVLSSLQKDLLDIDLKTKTFQQRISETKERLVKSEKEIVGKIQDMQDSVHQMFEELKRKVSHDIATFKEQVINLDTKMVSCETYVADVKNYLSDIENVTQLGTPSQKMIMFHYLKDQVRQLQQNTTKHMKDFKDVSMTFVFDEFLKLPPSKSVMPGRFKIKYFTTGDTQEVTCSKEKHLEDHTVNLKLLASIDLKQGGGDVEEPLYSGLDFLPDGRLVTVDNKNKKCLVYNEQLQMVGCCVLPNLLLDVVAVSGEEVAITTSAARIVHFLEIQDNNKVSLKESRNVTKKYDSICIIDKKHFAVGTTDDTQHVRIVSVAGEEQELGINFPTKTYPLGHSKCTYIQRCNKVILTDRFAHTVYIYDIASNTTVEVKDKKINEPRGVAIGPGDYILVCSKLTNTLVQISHTGQILSSHMLDIEHPYSVSVSKDNTKLAVSNSCVGERKLQLYSIKSQ